MEIEKRRVELAERIAAAWRAGFGNHERGHGRCRWLTPRRWGLRRR